MQHNQGINSYRVLTQGGVGEIVEKKSRFIATIQKCETEEEAVSFIEEMKKKNWNASHNCSAFVIGNTVRITRCSDDGEPSGTAGRPMLEVLLGEGIGNVAVVVTRYFGGTLLGTGGLIRAYTQAVKEGLRNCSIGIMRMGVELEIITDYNGIGKINYLLGQRKIEPTNSSYTERVCIHIVIPKELEEEISQEITEATCGQGKITKIQEVNCTLVNDVTPIFQK